MNHDHAHHGHGKSCCSSHGEPAAAVAQVRDPVCGMTVDPAKTGHHAWHDGEEFHFCSAGCRTRFLADPEHYLSDAVHPEPEATPGAMWTCPMHPQIRQEGPGICPICSMALEPEEPSLDDKPNPELVDFTRRLWISAILAVPLLAVSMGAEMLGLQLVSPAASRWGAFARRSTWQRRSWSSWRSPHCLTAASRETAPASIFAHAATI